MESSTSEISRLCETWWGKFAENTKQDQCRFAEQLLGLLGWHSGAGGKSGLVVPFPAPDVASKATSFPHFSYILRGQAQSAVAAHFVMPGALEPPAMVTQHGLEFCEATRQLFEETATLNVDYAFITDLYRSYLYDVRTEDLLVTANSPAEFRRDLVALLTRPNVERGALEEIRRQPRSHIARQLREWCHHWCETLCADFKVQKETAVLAMDRLLILRYLVGHDILKRSGWRLGKRFQDLVSSSLRSASLGCGRQLRALFQEIYVDYKLDLFAPVPALDAVFDQDEFTMPMLKEFAMHSSGKFSIGTILESFNYGDAMEKARVRMVPDSNEDREQYLSKQTLSNADQVHIQIDLADEGYRAIFYWFDRLVALYERLDVEFENQVNSTPQNKEEMDLFAWSDMAAKRPEALFDKFQHAVEKGLTLYYSSPRQLRTAKLMLCLHLISHYYRSGSRFAQFPDMNKVFQLRPRVLENDRKWIFQGRASEDEW